MPLLLVLTATGLYLSKPSWVSPILDVVAGVESEHADSSATTGACGSSIGFDTALARAGALVPGGHLSSFTHDHDAPGRWLIAMETDSAAAPRMTHVVADLNCGTVSIKDTPQNRPSRDATELWLMSLHDGSAFGTAGEILATVVGLVPLLLAWSGVRMWLRRRRVAKGRTVKVPAGVSVS